MRGKLNLLHESEMLSLRTPIVYPSFGAYSRQLSSLASCLAPWQWPNPSSRIPPCHQKARRSPKSCQTGSLHRSLPTVWILYPQCHMAPCVHSGTTWRCSIFHQLSGTPLTSCSTENLDAMCWRITPKTPTASQVIRSSR